MLGDVDMAKVFTDGYGAASAAFTLFPGYECRLRGVKEYVLCSSIFYALGWSHSMASIRDTHVFQGERCPVVFKFCLDHSCGTTAPKNMAYV